MQISQEDFKEYYVHYKLIKPYTSLSKTMLRSPRPFLCGFNLKLCWEKDMSGMLSLHAARVGFAEPWWNVNSD